MPAIQGRYWLLTIFADDWTPALVTDCTWLIGQKEQCPTTNRQHWQVVAHFNKRRTIRQVQNLFPNNPHVELSNGPAANEYVHKDDTYVEGTRFELGSKPLSRNSRTDWDAVRRFAQNGQFDEIPSDVYIRYRGNLRAIHIESTRPPFRNDIVVKVYYGPPGTGKTTRAIQEAEATGEPYYIKNSRTKWWDGYQGELNVIFDEFSGDSIDVDYCKRWWDKFPCLVEVKGGTVVLRATRIWITSNIHPDFWFRQVDEVHRLAIKRRISVIELMDNVVLPNSNNTV